MKKMLSMLLILSLLLTFTSFADDYVDGEDPFYPPAPNPTVIDRITVIAHGSTTLYAGQTLSLSISVSPSSSLYGRVEWDSSNPSVAYVDSNGFVYANQKGDARISASVYNYWDGSYVGSASTYVTVTGSTPTPTPIKRVTVTANRSTTLGVKQSVQLHANITPKGAEYDSIEWDSTDPSIAYVNAGGRVTAKKKGEVTIYATVYGHDANGRNRSLGSGSIDITVKTSNPSPSPSDDPDDHSVSSQRISAATLTNAVKTKVKKGKTTNATFDNIASVAVESLHTAAKTMNQSGGTVLLNFDTQCDIDDFEGRVTINPNSAANLKGVLSLLVHTESNYVSSVRTKFNKIYRNTFMVAKSDQHGGYGMKVTYTLPLAKGLVGVNEGNLVAYSYNAESNKLTLLSSAEITVDTKGFVRLTTSASDYIIISNGKLTK